MYSGSQPKLRERYAPSRYGPAGLPELVFAPEPGIQHPPRRDATSAPGTALEQIRTPLGKRHMAGNSRQPGGWVANTDHLLRTTRPVPEVERTRLKPERERLRLGSDEAQLPGSRAVAPSQPSRYIPRLST